MRQILILTILVTILAATIIGTANHSHAKIYIDINSPSSRRLPIAIPDFKMLEDSEPRGQIAAVLYDVLAQDLTYSGFFDILDKKSYIEDPKQIRFTEREINFKDWSVIGADLLIKGGVSLKENEVTAEMRLFDVVLQKTLIIRRYTGKKVDARRMMHKFANEVIELLTGERGIFDTRMFFVSEASGNKEIYVSDYDGHNVKQITHNKSINISPQWSPDGKSILYTSYKEGQPYLYIFELYTGKETRISNYAGINIGARWSPTGREIALTLSKDGNPELYILDIESKEVKRLTNNSGIDVSPAWAPDGKKIAFVSDIAGNPNIYVIDSDGANLKRLTFEGKYNASPAWSPKGDKISFARLNNGTFDIWVMNTDGSQQTQLTSDSGNNENPSWSANGRYIAFSSTRGGGSQIYIMRSDGINQKKITKEGINQRNPSWSPFQR